MRTLDTSFLIDYQAGTPETKAYYDANGASEDRWMMPTPAHADTPVSIGNHPTGDSDHAIETLTWSTVYAIDEDLSVTAARIADEITPQSPYLDGVDALIAAVGREIDAPVVAAEGDLTHTKMENVVNAEEYRQRSPRSSYRLEGRWPITLWARSTTAGTRSSISGYKGSSRLPSRYRR